MTDQPVIVSEADGIITITLNRPEAKNAVNKALAEGVSNALDKLESDPALRVATSRVRGALFAPVWISKHLSVVRHRWSKVAALQVSVSIRSLNL